MRDSLIQLLRCPRCSAEASFSIEAAERDEREIRSGSLACSSCGHVSVVQRGVVDLLPDPPEVVRREAEGLARFADVMRADGWDRERVLRLPDEPSPYWHGQRTSFAALLDTVDFAPGQRLLDVGANTCWASAAFARRGLDVLALDITRRQLQGLDTGR